MNVCYNRCIYIDYRLIKDNGECLVVYQRFEHYVSDILDVSILTHYVGDGRLSEETKRKYINKLRFDPESNSISLLWDKYPVDHFLCVNYAFIENEMPKNNLNWLKDGF